MKTTIRKATPKDIQAILTIERLGINTWKEDFFIDEINNPISILLVAEQETIIGFATAWLVHDEIQLNNIAVLPDYRKQGIAQALIKEIVTIFKNAKKIILEVNENNTAAKQFYKKLGFTVNGKRKSYYGNEDAYLMEKDLNDEV